MDFNKIESMVFHEDEISPNADLIDMYAYYALKAINCLYLHNNISQSQASKHKKTLMKKYKEQKSYEEWRKEQFKWEVENISATTELRVKLNIASKEKRLDKETWLEAVDCVNRLCGDPSGLKNCAKYLEDYEEPKGEVENE